MISQRACSLLSTFAEFDGDACFDYTAVISGCLKSIEQLLYEILKITAGGVTVRNRGYGKDWCPERIRNKYYIVLDEENEHLAVDNGELEELV